MSVSTILGAAKDAALATTPVKTVDKASKFGLPSVKEIIPIAAGGAAGAYLWKKHPWLGLFLGMAAGEGAQALYQGTRQDKVRALLAVGATATGAVASIKWRKHPVLGYIGGVVVGGMALRAGAKAAGEEV